jgi:hypothetical protein
MILLSDNNWSRCKDLNSLLLFKMIFFMFMGGNIEHWTLNNFLYKCTLPLLGGDALSTLIAILTKQ